MTEFTSSQERDRADRDDRDRRLAADLVADPVGERGLVRPAVRGPLVLDHLARWRRRSRRRRARRTRARSRTASSTSMPPSYQSVAEIRTRHRPVGRPHRAHRVEDLERVAQPVRQRAAVVVGAPVGQRRQERRQQVAVRAVQLEQVEAGPRARRAAAATNWSRISSRSARVSSRGTWLAGRVRQRGRAADLPVALVAAARRCPPTSAWSSPCGRSGRAGGRSRRRTSACTNSTTRAQAASCSSVYRPAQPGVIRPAADTQAISVITSPAPPSALPPRCTRWKSDGTPSAAEYMSIGETITRLRSRSPRSRNGWNIGGGCPSGAPPLPRR